MERTDNRYHAKGLRTYLEWHPTMSGDDIDVTCVEVSLPGMDVMVIRSYPTDRAMAWLLVALDVLGYSYYEATDFIEEYLEIGQPTRVFLKRIDAAPSTEDLCEWDGSCSCGQCPECGHPCSSSCNC